MRNLQILDHYKAFADYPNESSNGRKAFTAYDPDSEALYAAIHRNDTIYVYKRDRTSAQPSSFNMIASLPTMEDREIENFIIDFVFLPDAQAACLCTSGGDIALVHGDSNMNQDPLEVVGSVDSGILAVQWSPDQEVVVLITGARTVLEMTRDFDTITEFPLDTEEEGEGVSHSVGWGKKETQFHGSEGKAAAQRKADVDKYTTSLDDDQHPRVSWRGDGSYFVVSSIDINKGSRVLRVYNREGVLQNTSEPVDKLEHGLSWRPSGNLIASSQRLPHRHDIVFFERNGLRHGEFTLRENDEHKVIELLWNSDSSILAVWLQIKRGESVKRVVQLWTTNNYHWYLKQHLAFENDIIGFNWDVEQPFTAHIWTADCAYHSCRFTHDILTSTSTSPKNSAYVAVIDGTNVLLTPFLYQNVPPPMCSLTVTADENVQEVAFSSDPSGSQIALLTASWKVIFVQLPPNGRGSTSILGTVQLDSSAEKSLIRHLKWINESQIVYLEYSSEREGEMLSVLDVDFENSKTQLRCRQFVDKQALRLYCNADSKDLLLQLVDGKIHYANLEELEFENTGSEEHQETNLLYYHPLMTLPGPCQWIGTTSRVLESGEKKRILVALSDRGKLYVDGQLISSECTSFFLRHNFLVFTTTSHVARFLPLDTEISDPNKVEQLVSVYDQSSRRVERGAKIVVAVQDSPKLVLQMPRGNLETVSPRAFVLSNIRNAIERIDYRSAFLDCRTNRIDLNILYDENPKLFMDNAETILSQVHEVDHINLFLSNLRNEDVTVTMYPKAGAIEPSAQPASTDDKVNTICSLVRDVLLQRDAKRYIQAVLSTYVRSTPSDLESALRMLADLKSTDLAHAEEALSYTIFLCDADRLFDVALGMYDFSLVLMVAQQSQKDPREYLPFLQELQELEKYYQRFKIDDHLKRYRKAIENLSKAGNQHFDELVTYARKHTLYTVALQLYPNTSTERKTILMAYAEYLQGRTQYEEAAIAYTLAGANQDALDAYCLGNAWKEAFSIAKQLQYSEDAISDLAYSLIESLKEKRRYDEAARIALDYAKDVENAVESLIKGNHWSESVRVSHSFERGDLIETHIKPGLAETFAQHKDDIKDMQDQFEKQTTRLRELREKKPDPYMNMPDDPTLENVDMFSDTTSMYSQFTRYTSTTAQMSHASARSSRSSKSKRREERKKHSGRKGTIYEEEYLVSSLKRLYERASGMQIEIGEMSKSLVVYGYMEEAKAIQRQFLVLLDKLSEAIDGIFIPLQLQQPPNEDGVIPPATVIEKPTMLTVKWRLELLLDV
ncbi:putative elongator complex protein 1 [Umbelopsis sp. WA50703]